MIYTLTGSNTYALSTKLRELETKAQQDGASIERVDAYTLEDPRELLNIVSSVSLFEPSKLIIVRSLSVLADIIDHVIERCHENNTVVLTDPTMDKRSKLYKTLRAETEFIECADLTGSPLRSWIAEFCKHHGVSIQPAAVNELINRVGEDQQYISQELTTLCLSSDTITKELVSEYVDDRPQSKIFDLLDSVFSGNIARVDTLYAEQRAQGEEPQKILGMITWQLNQLFKAHAAQSQSDLVASGMSSYSASKSLQLARRITAGQTTHAIDELVAIDSQLKSGADADTAVLSYLTELATF